MVEESPTIKEGEKTEATNAEATEKVDLDGMISLLDGAGVTTPDELENKLIASREVGYMAQQVGDLRKELASLKNKPAPEPPPKTEYDPYEQQGPVDIERALEGAVEKVLTKREEKQLQIQRQQMQVWSEIQSHPYYPKVKEIFEQKMQSPEMMTKIQGGQTTTKDEFFNTVIEFQGGVIQKAHGTLVTIKGGEQAPVTPTVEGGEARVSAQVPEVRAEKEELIDGFKVKVDKGGHLSDTEQMAALDAILKP
jgi:hypothetical protein